MTTPAPVTPEDKSCHEEAVHSVPLIAGIALSLTREEQLVHDYLSAQWVGFERRFYGALRVLADPHNPERFCHAAHTLREIMTEMENRFSGRHVSLGSRMQKLLTALVSTRTAVQNFANSAGTEQAHVAATIRYIESSEAFLKDFEDEQVTLRKRVENLLMEMDPAVKASLPGWRARLSGEWREIKGVLVRVAHSGPITESEFTGVKNQWIAFLVDRARPQTTADQETLLKLIEESENQPHANP